MTQTILSNMHIIDPVTEKQYTGGIVISENGTIHDIGKHITGGTDMQGKLCMPGAVDLRCHFADPGNAYKESLSTTLDIAVKSGITALVVQPTTHPVLEKPSQIRNMQERCQKSGVAKTYFLGAMTQDLDGKKIAEIGRMHNENIVGVSNGNNSIYDTKVLALVFEYVSMFDLPIHLHAMDYYLSKDTVAHTCASTTAKGLSGVSALAESLEIQKILQIAKDKGVTVHISHISTKESVDCIRKAKAEGQNVTADVCHHHLWLTYDDIKEYKTHTKIIPPLRSKSDKHALIDGICDGTIDAIVSDHTPQDSDSKRIPFEQASFGAVGLQSLVIKVIELCQNNQIPMTTAIKALTVNPAKIAGIDSGTLHVGLSADFTLIDTDTATYMDKDFIIGQCKNTPYENSTIPNAVFATYVNGVCVFKHK